MIRLLLFSLGALAGAAAPSVVVPAAVWVLCLAGCWAFVAMSHADGPHRYDR
jgi:hypothetical protein